MKNNDLIAVSYSLVVILVACFFFSLYYKIDKSEKKIEEIHHLLVDKVEK